MSTSSSSRWPIGTTGAIWLAFAMVLGHYAVMFGVGGPLALLLGLERGEIFKAPLAAFVVIITVGVVEVWLVLVVGMRRFARLTFHETGWRDRALRDVGYGLLGLALCIALLAAIFTAELGGDVGAALDHMIDKVASFTPAQRLFFVIMGLVAAIPEETIFRGILQPTLQRKLGRWQGLVVVAVVFAAHHFMFRWPAFLGKLGFGLIFGVLRERTGTLWAPALAHALAWAVLGSM